MAGQADAMEIAFGDIVGQAFDPVGMLDGLGARWSIEGNFFKLHASCRETHGAVETWNDLAATLPARALDPGCIGSIEVATFDDAARLDERNPANPLAARYSLPFALATRIVRGSAFIEDFSQEVVDDARVRDLAGRVEVVASEALGARFPGERLTHLTVRLKDGTSVSAQRDGCDGDPSRPVDVERLRSKFLDATRAVWGEAATGLFELWRGIDRETSVRTACNRSRRQPDLV
jgi:2-methylcitrate dehydratase PrpD